MAWDYIVVGAGSAGCVIATRLSERPATKVLLLEAGGVAQGPMVEASGMAPQLEGSSIDWAFRTTPQSRLDGRMIDYPRGRCLGGSSAINYCLYVRGARGDYDHWAQLGNAGWSYDDVLPYFRRAESNDSFDDAYHGVDGPLSVERYRHAGPLHEIYLEAAQAVGLPLNPDFNGAELEGCGYYQSTLRDGRRCSAADAYLSQSRDRPNLDIQTGATITRILVEGGRARGVEYLEQGRNTTQAMADAEVILCSGSIGSPQILMLSGIGPADHLRSLGVEIVFDHPGVGQNLMDHLGRMPVSFTIKDPEALGARTTPLDEALAEFARSNAGPVASMHIDTGGFCRLRSEDAEPSAQLVFTPGYSGRYQSVGGAFSVHLGGYVCRPQSKGAVTLASANPLDRPVIDPNYLSVADDLDRSVEVIEKNLEIAHAAPFDAVRGDMADDLSSREKIVAYIRRTAKTTWHPTSTCRMGVDDRAVVDPQLRFRGIDGLRVCDASIMPSMVSGNTNAPTIMIAEKAADLIRGTA